MGVHIYYNKEVQDYLKFSKTIKNLCNVLKPWLIRKYVEGEITIFKSIAISTFVRLVIITKVPNILIEELKQMQKNTL